MSSQKAPERVPPVCFDEFEVVSYDRWKEEATAALKGGSFEKQLFTRTYEGITLEPIYTMEHAASATHKSELPGACDYLRGSDAAGNIAKPWTVAQSADGVLPGQVNAVLKRELEKGSEAVNFPLADAVLRGCEPDCKDFAGSGVLLGTLKDMKAALDGVALAGRELQLYAGAGAAPLLAMLAACDKEAVGSFKGCVGADPLGLLAETGSLPASLDSLYDEMAACAKWTSKNAPGVKTVLVRGDVYHNGGASAVQEVAYCIATATEYLDAMLKRGVELDAAASQIRFSLSLGANFFMEIAKLRAARMVWSQVVAAYGGSEDARKMDIFARTSYFTETVYDPYVNILRTTSQTFSGVVGGADALQVAPFDEAVGASDEQSRRIARNIQLMFQNEFHMLYPIDPAGGSWYVESLTQQLAEKIWEMFKKLDAEGGMPEMLKQGSVQADVSAVLSSRLSALATRRDRAVGSNMYANMTEAALERERMTPDEVKAAWGSRAANANLPAELLSALDSKADDLVCKVIAAFEAGATLAQVRSSLAAGADGLSVTPIPATRWTKQYEALRSRTESYEARTGETFKVFLANMGPIPQHKARADFITGFMQVAHFDVLGNDGFASVEAAAEAAAASGAGLAVICSTDATYPELVPPLARLIKEKCPDMLVMLAGAPAADMKDAYLEAGVDDFVHIRSNCLEMLTAIQDKKGV